MKNSLPLLKNMILPSFFTLVKGVKIKKDGIEFQEKFNNVEIDKASLSKYKQFFNWDSELPLAFFYLMAQRAQTSLMLRSEFTISIPGLVHISNQIEKFETIDYNSSFDLIANVIVPFKETGSLIPIFTVDFMQNDKIVISCKSTYIAKRKANKKSSTHSSEYNFIENPTFQENWLIPKKLGRIYAKASGDKNPIHYSTIFAKIIGFRSPIMQGWYSVSKIVKDCELENNQVYNSIEVDFKSPIFIPSNQKLEWKVDENKVVLFQITDSKTNKIVLNGKLK